MSANLVVDLGNTTHLEVSIASAIGVGGTPASGQIVGEIVDLNDANTFCNAYVAGGPTSGIFSMAVQTSDSLTSGSFTDPTSGLAQLPTSFLSGGVFVVNSGIGNSGRGGGTVPPVSGAPAFCSGGLQAAGFQRPHRYARLMALSGGSFDATVVAGFITQSRTTGSGGGFTLSPSSGLVEV